MPLGMIGKYERLDVLGHGVSGIVYLAKDTLLNKQVALKEVDVQAGDLRRFLEEARVMDRLRHPNIVRVNGVDRIDGKVVIDMEYVRGQNLQEILRTEGALPVDRAMEIAIQVLDALEFAHRMQTVHRDIKPANILITQDGSVKLVDFGLAEILATNAYAGGAGTYAYMAPEDFAEEDRSDHQSDIWAVGVTLYEMLTGARPFQVLKVKDPFAWKRVLETEFPTPLDVYLEGAPRGLQAVLDRALARDKARRYESAGEFRDALRQLREDSALSSATLRNILPAHTPVSPSEFVGAETTAQPPIYRNGADSGYDVVQPTRSMPIPSSPAFPPAPTWQGPGTVVAEVGGAQNGVPAKRRSRLPFLARKEARLSVDPQSMDFGMIRKGEVRSIKFQARVQGLEGPVEGRVLHTQAWLTVQPEVFDRARQTITLTAHSGRAWETGEFNEIVRVETSAGVAEVPVHMTVLRARPTFGQVAAWYLPCFAAAMGPALAVAFGGGGHALSKTAVLLIPSAALCSGLLAAMLLFVCVAAETGLAERLACGVLMTVMCFVLGVSAASMHGNATIASAMEHAIPTGLLVGLPVVLQLFTLARWKFWGIVLFCLGLVLGSGFVHLIAAQ